MADPKSIAAGEIDASDRIRPVDEGYAQAIGASIAARGLINRIGIRQTPNGAKKWKLVTGAHRLRGLEIAGIATLREGIEYTVLKVDAAEARMIEAEENLARNDLSKLERALSILAYRQAWTRKFGPLNGGDRRSGAFQSAKLGTLNAGGGDFTALGDRVGGFSAWTAERLGLSERTIKRLSAIAEGIRPELARLLFGTPYSDNQSVLEGLARLSPQVKANMAKAAAAGMDLDVLVDEALYGRTGEAPLSINDKRHYRALDNLQRQDEASRRRTLQEVIARYPADVAWALASLKRGEAA